MVITGKRTRWNAFPLVLIRVCLKNFLIRNFGVFSAISASSILDLALLSLRIYSLN